jgi:hypothetical protein
MSSLHQTGPQLPEVVDLSVEEKPEPLTLICCWLIRPGAKVNDPQASVAEHCVI